MFCTRCQKTVPDFLWNNNDHPVLAEGPVILNQGPINPDTNTVVFTASIRVQARMCSDVYVVNVR